MMAGHSRISDLRLRPCAVLTRRNAIVRREKKSVLFFIIIISELILSVVSQTFILRKMYHKAISGYSTLSWLKVALNAD